MRLLLPRNPLARQLCEALVNSRSAGIALAPLGAVLNSAHRWAAIFSRQPLKKWTKVP